MVDYGCGVRRFLLFYLFGAFFGPSFSEFSMRRMHLDYETFSEFDLKKFGGNGYFRHLSTAVRMAAYGFDDDDVRHWDATREPMPDDLRQALLDPETIIYAWNAAFEMGITEHVLGIRVPIERWRDTMVMALYVSLPASLERAAKIVKTPLPKMSEGKRLIRKFCLPRKPTKKNPATVILPEDDPEDWQLFIEYNIRDVEVERDVYHKLKNYAPPESEWALWALDQKINQNGYPINLDFVSKVCALVDEEKALLEDELKELTGLDNPNSVTQFQPWLQERGYLYKSLDKEHVAKALAGSDINADARQALELRQEASKSSVSKYPKILLASNEDSRLRGTMQFYGARTGRWSGRIAQFQNLPRPAKWIESQTDRYADMILRVRDIHELRMLVENPMEVFSSLVRASIQAPPGFDLVVADLASIETRVLGWIAECTGILGVYKAGKDAYKEFATLMFRKIYEEVTKAERNLAKPPVLGCGYMLGAKGLARYAEAMGVTMTVDEADYAKNIYRETYWEVPVHWQKLDRAFRRAIDTGRPTELFGLYFDVKGPFVRIRLPSGRHLYYLKPRIETVVAPWSTKDRPATIDAITYEAPTSEAGSGGWGRTTTHAGKIEENVVQAIARDILAHGLIKADEAGLHIFGHVHDETKVLVPEGQTGALELLVECMTDLPSWATGLPLDAEGYVSKVYKKD